MTPDDRQPGPPVPVPPDGAVRAVVDGRRRRRRGALLLSGSGAAVVFVVLGAVLLTGSPTHDADTLVEPTATTTASAMSEPSQIPTPAPSPQGSATPSPRPSPTLSATPTPSDAASATPSPTVSDAQQTVTVVLTGPTTLTVGESGTYTALTTWSADDPAHRRFCADSCPTSTGPSASCPPATPVRASPGQDTNTTTIAFDKPGSHTFAYIAGTDCQYFHGDARDTLTVTVTGAAPSPSDSPGPTDSPSP